MFKDDVKLYLVEAVKKVENYQLMKGVKTNDVILGWSKIRNPANWSKITEREFINYIETYIRDQEKRLNKSGKESLDENFTKEDYKDAYLKFRAILMDEKKLKKGQVITWSDLKHELDKNPGRKENMIISIFLSYAGPEAHRGVTSKSFRENLMANSAEDTKEYKRYYK